MSRRIAREVALQSLFQIDFNECSVESAVTAALAERNERLATKVEEYAMLLTQGVRDNLTELDECLEKFAVDWSLARMPATDRNILRIGAYEMLVAEERLAAGIAINEAVELAKLFGTDESPRFVNGVLGKLARA